MGSDDGTACDALATGWKMRRRDVRPPSDWNFK